MKCCVLKLRLSSDNRQNSMPPVPTHTYLPTILDFNREEENLEESTRNEHETCSDSDSGDIMSPLLKDVAIY